MEMTWADRLRETGRLEGLEAGRQEGVALGRQEGVALGREKGRREGVAVARRLLLELVTSRFGSAASGIADRFEALDDLAEIAGWSEKVLRARSLSELDVAD